MGALCGSRDPGATHSGSRHRIVPSGRCGPFLQPTGVGRALCRPPARPHRRECVDRVERSREASRAVQDALPFMSASSPVPVLLVDPDDELADVELAQDLVAHLGRHGLNAKTQMIRHDLATLAVSDTILTHVAELDADLLVMGAYSHSRFREIILGGVTRDILRDMNVPVLMAH